MARSLDWRPLGANSETPSKSLGDALRFTGVTKTYPGVRALDVVDLAVARGEIRGLVGENGAGKSTLMGIGAGSISADSGEVEIDGKPLRHASPELARQLGLAVVYQEPALISDLSIAENLAIGVAKEERPGWRSATSWATQLLAPWTSDRMIDPAIPVRDLGPDIRFIVEICKAVSQAPRVLLLDEPTEHLAAADVEILFRQVKELAQVGTAIVYISHRIKEVQQISDRISVLRDGRLLDTFEADEVTYEQIVTSIVGRSLEAEFPPKRPIDEPLGGPVLSVKGLRSRRLASLDLDIHPGEIVGLAGIEGNGQVELVRALAGLISAQGEVTVDGHRLRSTSSVVASQAGIAFVPSERHREGMLSGLTLRENVAIGSISDYARLGVVSSKLERTAVAARVTELAIKVPSLETRIESLSGGNQQKAIFGRSLQRNPKVILADEPTQGVDVGARLEIFRLLRGVVSEGAGALVVASDAAELAGLCDRVLVMSRGHVIRELNGSEVTEAEMTEAALTAMTSRSEEVSVKKQSRLRRFLRGDFAPPAIVLFVAFCLAAYTSTQSSYFLTASAFTGILTLFAVLALASMAQQVVMIAGGIDLSIGPLMGFLVVIASFVIVPGQSQPLLVAGWLLLVAIALTVGFVNWFPSLISIPPFLATLVTYIALQGLSLAFRKQVGGEINLDVISFVSSKVGWVPWAAIFAVMLGIALEFILRLTTWGVKLRAVGSAPEQAHAVGIRVDLIRLSSYLAAGLLAFLASVLLMAQVGAGDPNAGVTYTLTSITAVVLGGASIFGGRGAFIGALGGAILIGLINASVSFLSLNTAWSTYLLGGLILLAGGAYSLARGTHA